ncbi:Uma2 family endonuclease [Paludisphaera mucosa]|uniref:Uma2 family endonuclease n=1 Tax=Paludisphaera mucosa TaxID=3030827 RepID=A0ABT6FK46_9BACT|nr:Uma2 family endonuclease [Paludisphaera mucosa]MDG3007950.1 Uma2 family endonuclease [Paludisphaera mucosa]
MTPPGAIIDISPQLASRLSRLSVAQYDRLIAADAILDAEKVELIEGLLVAKTGRNRPRIQAGKLGFAALLRIVPDGWRVAKEDPITASDWSKPEPDLAVIRGEIGDYARRDLTTLDVGLVVEIAESSLAVDRDVMGRLYAAGGIPCYWIVNLVDGLVEVYTDADPSAGYCSRREYLRDETIPIVLDGREAGVVAVEAILPGPAA